MALQGFIDWLKGGSTAGLADGAEVDPIHLATAAVLLEAAHADHHLSKEEEAVLVDQLTNTFHLTDETAREILESAEEHRAHTIDHWYFTSRVRQNLPPAKRLEIVKSMWRIVYSDGRLHQYEEYLVRKLSDLLGVEHHQMIEAKLEVKQELSEKGPEA